MKYIEQKTYKGATEIIICNSIALFPQARFAQDLMHNLAIAAAVPDGEWRARGEQARGHGVPHPAEAEERDAGKRGRRHAR